MIFPPLMNGAASRRTTTPHMMPPLARALLAATAALALLLTENACRSGAPAAATAAPGAAAARHAIVVAANPLAAQAGMHVLQAGGSAADAAVAMQAVLGLVEPQSSGLGGGAYMIYYDAKQPAAFPDNGRKLTDDVVDFFLPILTNRKVTTDTVGAHTDLLIEFPFVGPPHKDRSAGARKS